MNLLTNIVESISDLFSAKLRSLLAILGILVGTGSVVALIYCGQLGTEHALAQFKTLGTNLLSVSIYDQNTGAKSKAQSQQLTLSVMPKIKQVSKQIVEVAPYTSLYKSFYIDGVSDNGQVLGATQTLADVAKIKLARGRFVSVLDGHQKYCDIGSQLASEIRKKGIDPMYQQISLGKNIFTIIGVLKPWKPSFFFYADINKGVVIPIGSSYFIQSHVTIQNILFRLIQHPEIKKVQAVLKNYLTKMLPNKQINFQNPQKIIDVVGKQRKTFTLLLSSIGAISLIVGGIGVMNIMLVSVIERRREIGVRMAIGAKRMDILRMFLIESVLLTVFGGALGVIIGVFAAFIISKISHWNFTLITWPIVLGFLVSMFVGVVSGFYPALSASKLDPIECLRSD